MRGCRIEYPILRLPVEVKVNYPGESLLKLTILKITETQGSRVVCGQGRNKKKSG
jgi:hypothetical protein